jgi:hypothetical protein
MEYSFSSCYNKGPPQEGLRAKCIKGFSLAGIEISIANWWMKFNTLRGRKFLLAGLYEYRILSRVLE